MTTWTMTKKRTKRKKWRNAPAGRPRKLAGAGRRRCVTTRPEPRTDRVNPDGLDCVARNAAGGVGLGLGGGFCAQQLLVNVAGGALVAHIPPGNGRALHMLGPSLLGGAFAGLVLGALVGAWLSRPPRSDADGE